MSSTRMGQVRLRFGCGEALYSRLAGTGRPRPRRVPAGKRPRDPRPAGRRRPE